MALTHGRLRAALLAVATLIPGQALATDRAFIVGNGTYAQGAAITQAGRAALAARALQVAGFAVTEARDLDAAGLADALSTLVAAQEPEDRLVILMVGHFAQSATQGWFLATDAATPDLGRVGAAGVAVQTLLDIAAAHPGGAVVLLGTEARRLPLGRGLSPGIGPVTVPQGVTLVQGDAARIADFAASALPRRGTSLVAMLEGAPDLAGSGFLAPLVPFRPGTGVAPVVPDADDVLWQATRAIATPEAYDAYVARFPEGRHASDARTEAARIRDEPGRQARLVEDGLSLTRDDRRAVQSALSVLGFEPGGIDGLFGAGSRRAIAAWQGRNGLAPTGFLTREALAALSTQSDRRSAELEAAASARRAETERADRLYWEETGAAGDETGYRTYLKRYPDGLFAEVAAERLAVIEEARRAQSAATERIAWDTAVLEGSIASYSDYLAAFPEGAFIAEAQARIDALTQDARGDADREGAEAAEAGLNLGAPARQLIEARLEALSLRPGPADGVFDDQTRRAVRRFQALRDLPGTGFLDQATMVSLLADGLLQFGD